MKKRVRVDLRGMVQERVRELIEEKIEETLKNLDIYDLIDDCFETVLEDNLPIF